MNDFADPLTAGPGPEPSPTTPNGAINTSPPDGDCPHVRLRGTGEPDVCGLSCVPGDLATAVFARLDRSFRQEVRDRHRTTGQGVTMEVMSWAAR